MGMAIDRAQKDPYRLEPLGDLNVVQFEDGTRGLEPLINSEPDQIQWLTDYYNAYKTQVSDWNASLDNYINSQRQQDEIDKQDINWLNQQKQLAWEETQAVYAEEARLIAQRNEDIRNATNERASILEGLRIDRANEKALEKLGLYGTSVVPVKSSVSSSPTPPPTPRDASLLLLLAVSAFLLR
jgi:hypothetical protein